MPTFVEGLIGQAKKHPKITWGVGLGAVGGAAYVISTFFRGGSGEVQSSPTATPGGAVRDSQGVLPQSKTELPGRSGLIDHGSTEVFNGNPYKCSTIRHPSVFNAYRAALDANGGFLPDDDVLFIPSAGDPILADLGRFGRERPGEERIFVHEEERICVLDHGLSALDPGGSVLYQRGESYQLEAQSRMPLHGRSNTPQVMHAARGI